MNNMKNMSIIYKQEISNLEFANELGNKNIDEIQKQIKQLIAQKKYIFDMKINNKLSLSVLYTKQKQENINIKFLPFLPKEVNELIRNKLHMCKYETLDNIYENMIKDYIYHECYNDKMKFIRSQIGDQISKHYNRGLDRNATWRMQWVNDRTNLIFNEDTDQFNYEVLKDYKFTEEDKSQIAEKIIRGIDYSDNFGRISQKLFDPQEISVSSEMRNYLEVNVFTNSSEYQCSEYQLNNHFTYWNNIHMNIYLMKNIDKILKYWIEVEMEYLALVNNILKKLKAFYAITDKTKYWTKMYRGNYDKEELIDNIYNSCPDAPWKGADTNEWDKNAEEKIEKYCDIFIDKNKMPIINKNGKLTNKTNYCIMGYDIVKYLEHNTLAKKFDKFMFDFYNYDTFMKKYHYDYNYLAKLFSQFYITKSCCFREHIEINNLPIDYAEMRKMISYSHSNEGEEWNKYRDYCNSIENNYFKRSSDKLFKMKVGETIDKCYTVVYTKI